MTVRLARSEGGTAHHCWRRLRPGQDEAHALLTDLAQPAVPSSGRSAPCDGPGDWPTAVVGAIAHYGGDIPVAWGFPAAFQVAQRARGPIAAAPEPAPTCHRAVVYQARWH